MTQDVNTAHSGDSTVYPVDVKFAGIVRRCLSMRFIVRVRNEAFFQSVVERRAALAKYFAQMGVNLKLNEELGVAFLEAMPEQEDSIDYRFGRTSTLTGFETLLLFVLRKHRYEYLTGEAEFELPPIEVSRIRELLEEYRPQKEERKFQQSLQKALERFEKYKILLRTSSPDRYEISPVTDVLLTADEIRRSLDRAREYFGQKSRLDHSTENDPAEDGAAEDELDEDGRESAR